jgi:hypothetical protein
MPFELNLLRWSRTIALFSALFVLCPIGPSAAAEVLFKLVGPDGTSHQVTAEELEAIGPIELTTPLVGESGEVHIARGPLVRDVLAHFGIVGSVAHVTALDLYRADIPVDDFMDRDVILATQIDGRKLAVREKGPAWIVYPVKDNPELNNPIHEARSVWQIKEILVQ